MPRPLSADVPPLMRKRMEEQNIRTIRELAKKMDHSESGLGSYLRSGHPSLAVLVRMLKELGYACDSPEFELINEFVNVKGLQKQQVSSSINEPVRIEQYSYRQSTVQIRAA